MTEVDPRPMIMILPRSPRGRVLLARWTLLLLSVGFLTTGPRIIPCLKCDRQGQIDLGGDRWMVCDRSGGKGFLTVLESVLVLGGIKPPPDPRCVTYTDVYEDPEYRQPPFWEELK